MDKPKTMSVDDCFYPSDFYSVMEAEREKIPRMSRRKYAPIFIINTLRDKLESMETRLESPRKVQGEVSEEWTDETFLEQNADLDLEGTYLFEKKDKEFIKRLLMFAVIIKETDEIGLDPLEFSRLYCREIEFQPLELIWYFNSKYKLIGINAYLMKLKCDTQVEYFVKQLVSFCFSPCFFEDGKRRKGTKILQDFLHEIIIAAYCNPECNDALKKIKTVGDDILLKITNRLISADDLACSFLSRQFILATLQGVPLTGSVKKRYFSHQLNCILTSHKSQMSLQDVLQYQERFAGSISPENQGKADMILMLVGEPQSKSEVIETLTNCLTNIDSLNWEAFLLAITVWEQQEPDGTSAQAIFPLLKTVIRDLVSSGLAQESEPSLMAAFILARHCCLISPQHFSRYEKWYAGMFENEASTPANTPSTFEFLAKVLSAWVPWEPPCFLQVHAAYWPHVPGGSGMRVIWADYVALSKARISEYNEIEQAMGYDYEPNPNNPVQIQVEMAIKSFDTTKKLPNTISEMLMFRKQYYIEQFLPSLLRKPTGAVLSDARLRLIEVLNVSGKIPAHLYNAYKTGQK